MTFASYTAPQQQVSWTLPLLEWATMARKTFSEIIERRRVKASLGKLSAKDLRDVGLTENDVASIDHATLPSNGKMELIGLMKSRSCNW